MMTSLRTLAKTKRKGERWKFGIVNGIQTTLQQLPFRQRATAIQTNHVSHNNHNNKFPLEYSLDAVAPPGCVEDDTHQASRHQTRARQGDKPAHVDPGDHAPVDSPPGAITEADTNRGASDTLCRADRKRKLSRHDDGDGGTELHRETTSRRVQSDLVSERTHNVVSVCPQTDDDTGTSEGEDPERYRDLGRDLRAGMC